MTDLASDRTVEYLWVGPEYASRGLEDAWPLLGEAVDTYSDGKYTKASLLEKLKNKTAVLWLTIVSGEPLAALITWADLYESERRLTIPFAGGDLDALKGLYPVIEAYAKEDNCSAIEVWGRKGWERVGKEYGYEYIHTVVRKRL